MARSFLAVAFSFWLCVSFSVAASAAAPKPSWDELKPQQREVLAPLAQEWNNMDSAKKKKWLGIAKRYPGMTAEEQQRTQLQMHDWYSLTPEQRELVREKYKTIKKLPPEKRHEIKQKWLEYGQTSSGDPGRD
jgi:hypothetical protein